MSAELQKRFGDAARQAAPTTGGKDSPEVAPLNPRLKALVVDPINALSKVKRTVRGKVRTGEEIARAIPNVEAFLAEVDLQRQDGRLLDFFELNEAGQLLMKDDCREAYGLGENALQARIRQTRVVYRGNKGQVCTMTGEQFFSVTKKDKKGIPLEIEISKSAKQINPTSILMQRGLPTLKWIGKTYIGEYDRMNDKGQFDRQQYTWTEDKSLNSSRARYAYWHDAAGDVGSSVRDSGDQDDRLGSRGVLRVNLNLEP